MRESAVDFEAFAQRLSGLIPDYRRNLQLLTEGFTEKVKSLDSATEAGVHELEGMREEARGLTETASGVKGKVSVLRNNFTILRDANHDSRVTQAAHKVIAATDELFTAYEDLETFGLKIVFAAERDGASE